MSFRLRRVHLRELGNSQHEKVRSLFGCELKCPSDTVQQFRRCARRFAALKTTIPITTYAHGFGDFFLSYAASTPGRQTFPRSERHYIRRDAPATRFQKRCKLGLRARAFGGDYIHGLMVGAASTPKHQSHDCIRRSCHDLSAGPLACQHITQLKPRRDIELWIDSIEVRPDGTMRQI
jgi:hypothetical protein